MSQYFSLCTSILKNFSFLKNCNPTLGFETMWGILWNIAIGWFVWYAATILLKLLWKQTGFFGFFPNYHTFIVTSPDKTHRLSDFVVALYHDVQPLEKGPFPSSHICHRHRGYPGASETITITCHAAMITTSARYVYVYLEGGRRTLTLCELEVYCHQGNEGMSLYPNRVSCKTWGQLCHDVRVTIQG